MRPMLLASKSVVGIAPVSTPVEVETSGSIQDVAISGRSSGIVDTCRRTHDSCILDSRLLRIPTAGSAVSTPSSGRCSSGSLDLAEESMTPTAGSAVSTRCSSGSLDLAEESVTPAAGSAVSTVLVARPTLNVGDVLRGVVTGSLSLGSRFRSAATRNFG